MRHSVRIPPHHAVTVGLFLAWLAFAIHATEVSGDSGGGAVADVTYIALLAAGAIACLLRARVEPTDRLAWALMGIGIAFLALGEVWWSVLEPRYGEIPTPSPADALYLSFYPAAYAALIVLVRQRTLVARRDLWLDGAIGALCAAALAIAIVVPTLDVQAGDFLETATNLIYPVLDAVLLAFVIFVFALAEWRPGRSWILLGAGLATMTVADCGYVVQAAHETYVEGGVLDAVWAGAALLIGLAAWQPPGQASAPHSGDRRLIAVPAVCGLLALTMVSLGLFGEIAREAAVLALCTLLLVTWRLALVFAETQRTLLDSRREALTDGLTGLSNRRRLLVDLERGVESATEAEPKLFVLLDLDGFKAYNDSFGHPAGDELLARMGRRLATAMSPHGTAYRLGGDEFCVLASCSEVAAGDLVVAAGAALRESEADFSVDNSAGAVLIPSEANDPTSVLLLADSRMYADKGRASSRFDRVIVEACAGDPFRPHPTPEGR